MMVKVVFGSLLFLALVATGTSRYRYERPSRVVEIKQGRLQGTLVEVPLTSPFATNGDKNQVIFLSINYGPPYYFYINSTIFVK